MQMQEVNAHLLSKYKRMEKTMIKYLVTTDINTLTNEIAKNPEAIVIMVDGTVPSWTPRANDFHFDHHKDGGADIHLHEIPRGLFLKEDVLFVTTQVDADAQMASAYLQLQPFPGILSEQYRKLEAISYCCDHLAVPEYLSDLYEFGEKAVAAQKLDSDAIADGLGLSSVRKDWSKEDKEEFATACFKIGVEQIIDAINGDAPFPGENGEADEYLENIKKGAEEFKASKKILSYKDVLIFNCCEVDGYIDPRIPLLSAKEIAGEKHPFTVTQRCVVNKGEFLGYSYTIGIVPLHEKVKEVDYTKNAFIALTQAELSADWNHFDDAVKAAGKWEDYRKTRDNSLHYASKMAYWLCSEKLGWGGRKTVGGSPWNTPSKLSPMKVVDIILGCHNM